MVGTTNKRITLGPVAVRRVSVLPTWLLSRANARAQRLLQDAFAERALRPVHYRMLAALDEHGDLSQAELGRHLALDRKDVAVALDDLAERGLLRRRPDPADGRRNLVVLGDAGWALLPDLDLILARVQDDVLAPLSERQRATLVALLARLAPPDD